MPTYRLCPRCELNYITEDEEYCSVCRDELHGIVPEEEEDDDLFEPKKVVSGTITLEQAVKNVVVGLPYTLILEQPNFNTSINGLGTIQSMEQAVNNIILRLNQSYGGMVGPDENDLNDIIYDVNTMDLGEPRLFTGDKKIVMASGGFNKYGRTYIKHDKPYPFTVSAIIRAVTMGGPGL